MIREHVAGRNRFVSSTIILFSFYGMMIDEAYTEFKSLEGHLPIREIPTELVPKKVLSSLSTE